MTEEKDKISHRTVEQWSLKDGLVLVPFLASALALTWEVGYFLKIGDGSFGLFTLSEHITFAIQALPFALGITTLAVILFVMTKPGQVGPGSLFLIGGVTGAFVVLNFATSSDRLDVGEIVLSIIAVIPFTMILLLRRRRIAPMIALCVGLAAVFLLAYGYGVQTARLQIISTRSLSVIKVGEKGKDAATEIKSQDHENRRAWCLIFRSDRPEFRTNPVGVREAD
jgi:hypothetical protein